MSESRRRKSQTMRLMLAAVALLGIGAAVTAAAWEDRVYFSVEANAADFNLEGRVADEAGDWSSWQEADSPATALSVEIADMAPNSTRTIQVQIRNTGDLTAYVTGVGNWSADDLCNPSVGISPVDDPLELAAGAESTQYSISFTTDAWTACENWSGTFSFHALGSTDPS